MGRVTVVGGKVGMEAPSNIPKNFAGATWEQIIEVCQTNSVPDTWNVGDSKPMSINGTDYLIDIIGKNHDDYADGSGKAPLTFQMHDCYGTLYAMNGSGTNSGGWNSCSMRNTHLPAILTLMPSEVQIGIKKVYKLAGIGGGYSGVVSSEDKLFLLSEVEIFGSVEFSEQGEGSQYAYYSAGNSRIKTYDNSAYAWRTRSPRSGNSGYFVLVDTNGGAGNASAQHTRGVAFAFCF